MHCILRIFTEHLKNVCLACTTVCPSNFQPIFKSGFFISISLQDHLRNIQRMFVQYAVYTKTFSQCSTDLLRMQCMHRTFIKHSNNICLKCTISQKHLANVQIRFQYALYARNNQAYFSSMHCIRHQCPCGGRLRSLRVKPISIRIRDENQHKGYLQSFFIPTRKNAALSCFERNCLKHRYNLDHASRQNTKDKATAGKHSPYGQDCWLLLSTKGITGNPLSQTSRHNTNALPSCPFLGSKHQTCH